MIDVIRKNKLIIISLGLMLILFIILAFIFLNKNSAKVPIRGVFVNNAGFLYYI
ncbi:MAG TPA: hypothetical protein GXX37_03770 [Clostridiaceae bacterium]|nr:hypothetical protein [Clostridiaceae bacterium]